MFKQAEPLLIVVAVASAALYYFLHGSDSFGDSSVLDWALKLLATLAFALIVNGAWAIFFTSRSKGHFTQNLVLLLWVAALLVAIGEWSSMRGWGPWPGSNLLGKTHQPSPESKERRIDEVRRLYPRFANLPDAEVLRLIAQDYPVHPMDRIAADIGLKVVRTD